MTGFDSKRQATADKLNDDDAQGYIAQFEEALQKEYQRGYDAGKASQPEQEPVAWGIRKEMEIKTVTMRCKDYDVALPIIDIRFGHVFVGQVFTPPKRPWVGLTEANMKVLIEQARVVPNQVPCPDYNERLLMLTNAVLMELNT